LHTKIDSFTADLTNKHTDHVNNHKNLTQNVNQLSKLSETSVNKLESTANVLQEAHRNILPLVNYSRDIADLKTHMNQIQTDMLSTKEFSTNI